VDIKSNLKKIHIVHIVYSFGTGGMEHVIANVITGLMAGYKHTLICLTCAGDSTKLLPKKVEIIELNKPDGNSFLFIIKLAKLLNVIHPDIVQAYNWSGMDAIIASRIVRVRNIIQSEHGWDINDPNGLSLKRKLFRRFISKSISISTCVSKQMSNWLIDDVKVCCPVTQIYNGVDVNRFCPGSGAEAKCRLGLAKNDFVLGIVGRLDPIKMHGILIRVCSRLQKRFHNIKLLIIGEGPEEEKLKKLSGANVYFLGNCLNVNDLLKTLDVFVLPSVNEGFSCAITEAMATGIPVIASNVGGNNELIGHGETGFLYEFGDELKLENYIEMYYKYPELAKRHGQAGRKKILKFFRNDDMITAYDNLYKKIIIES
jgi:sugar transferase (PEP-CTERM/EpsH1 system associated)